MRILKLTWLTYGEFSEHIWINFDLVQCLFGSKIYYKGSIVDCTRIVMQGEDLYYEVKETPEQIGGMFQ